VVVDGAVLFSGFASCWAEIFKEKQLTIDRDQGVLEMGD